MSVKPQKEAMSTMPRPHNVFKTELIRACYEKSFKEGRMATDDAQLVEWYSSVPIKVVESDRSNKKITLPQDLD